MVRGGLDVRGGPGGTVAVLAEVAQAGCAVLGLARRLAEVEGRLAAVLVATSVQPAALLAPASWLHARALTLSAVAGPRGAGAATVRLAVLGGRVVLAAQAYRAADATAAAVVRAAGPAVGAATGRLVGPAAVVPLTVLAVTASAAGRVLPTDPVAEAAAGAVAGAVGLRSVTELAAVLPRLAASLPGDPLREPAGRLLVRSAARPGASAPAGVGDLAARVAGVSPGATDPVGTPSPSGTVRVERVERVGRRAWVVEVPGTQVWTPGAGPDPFDATGAVAAMAGTSTAGGRLVTAALVAAGARRGEPVLLAGHSQGGLLAAGLAADPAFRRRFSVTHVLTLGAPVGAVRVPADVRVLSLEHDGDLVPRLDGRANPATPTWTTVGARAPRAPGLTGLVAGPHEASGYAVTGARVDTSDDPGLRSVRAGLAPFLDGPGVTSTALEVTGRRSADRDGG